MKIFETKSLPLLKRALDVYTRQHEAISKNVANASNPDFKREKTDFSAELSNVTSAKLKATNERHIASPIYPEGPFGPGNNKEDESIDLSTEMGDLAINQVRYDFVARALRRMYNGLNMSITGRSS